MFRAGMTYGSRCKHGITFSLGGRMEGVPVEDLNGNAGDKEGFRRSGRAAGLKNFGRSRRAERAHCCRPGLTIPGAPG